MWSLAITLHFYWSFSGHHVQCEHHQSTPSTVYGIGWFGESCFDWWLLVAEETKKSIINAEFYLILPHIQYARKPFLIYGLYGYLILLEVWYVLEFNKKCINCTTGYLFVSLGSDSLEQLCNDFSLLLLHLWLTFIFICLLCSITLCNRSLHPPFISLMGTFICHPHLSLASAIWGGNKPLCPVNTNCLFCVSVLCPVLVDLDAAPLYIQAGERWLHNSERNCSTKKEVIALGVFEKLGCAILQCSVWKHNLWLSAFLYVIILPCFKIVISRDVCLDILGPNIWLPNTLFGAIFEILGSTSI